MKLLLPLCLISLVVSGSALSWSAQGRGASLKEKQSAAKADGDADKSELPTSRSDEARAKAEAEQRELASRAFRIADYDHNGWISFPEAEASLEIDKPRYLVYDANRDGGVTEDEYIAISIESYHKLGSFKPPLANPNDPRSAELLDQLFGGFTDDEDEVEYVPIEADSIFELFGQTHPRALRDRSVPEPDLITGPVPPFRRLNYDNQGGIGRADLTVLLHGAGLEERPNALIASLDTDGDEEISEAEFFAAMNP